MKLAMTGHEFQSSRMAAVALKHRFLGGEGLPPLIILHGLLGSSRNWNSAGRALTGAFSVYAVDQRNHGDSPHADSHTYKDLVDDLAAWMDREGLTSASLMGHSMGGKTSMCFACRFPKKVRQLYIADIVPKQYNPHYDEYLKAMQAIDLDVLDDRKDAERQLEDAVDSWGMRQFLLTNLIRDTEKDTFCWQVNIPALLKDMPDLTGNPLGPDDHFDGPTLFLRGGKSGFIEDSDRELIDHHFPHAHLVTLKGAGHNIHVEDKDTFVQAVLKAKEYFEKDSETR